jgi:23S rRNA-/tRNA-specific pseudouridylate synthase
LNKPGGLPAHATVDNATENALALFQRHINPNSNNVPYASLPQRLDTETSGLLMVATQKEFASYMSKLLQNKTRGATTNSSILQDDTDAIITKHYRCLVGITNRQQHETLKHIHQYSTLVTHYLDAQSPAPKRFVSQIPTSGEDEPNTTTKWLECQLRLVRVGEPIDRFLLLRNSDVMALMPTSSLFVAQVEVELLTGRTHQIRGQLAALGCPIVGDPLYGTTVRSVSEQRQIGNHRMALQCCAMEFPQPERQENTFVPSTTKKVSLKLDRAWWTEYLEK